MNLEDLHKAESIAKEQLKDFEDAKRHFEKSENGTIESQKHRALRISLCFLQTEIIKELERFIEIEEERKTKDAIEEELEGAARFITEALFLIKKLEGENNNFFELGNLRLLVLRVMSKYSKEST